MSITAPKRRKPPWHPCLPAGGGSTPLFIFSDGVKHPQADTAVKEVRNILHRPWPFLSIHYSESSVNRGLAKSIIEGVGKVLEQYEQVIVLEDDLVLSADFLEYMEQSLLTYRNDNRIWSISGYSPLLKYPQIMNIRCTLLPALPHGDGAHGETDGKE